MTTNQTIDNLWQQLHLAPVQPDAWLNLAKLYMVQGLPWQAAYAARQAARLDASLKNTLDALSIPQWQNQQEGDALLGRAVLPEAGELFERFTTWLKQSPNDWLTCLYVLRLNDFIPESQSRLDLLAHAQSLEPIAGETLHWLGVWRLNSGDAQSAINAFSGLLDIRPVRCGSMMYLGEALLHVGNIVAAEKAFSRASLSNSVDFLMSLSAKVYGHNYWQEAIGILQKANTLQPNSIPVLLALARIQSEVYLLADCRESLAKIQQIQANHHEAKVLYAGLQGRMGDAKGHLATLQTAYAESGDPLSRLASSISMTCLYHDELSAQQVSQIHRDCVAPIEAATHPHSDFPNTRQTKRRLRIGYVTGDLHRQHPVNIFMLPVLLKHNHQDFEICVYHTGTMQDEYTRLAKQHADYWLEAANLDDNALQRAILANQIDILVDLAGHTSTHRLGVFAMRAAPVQATFLGYPHSTGLTRIDWLIGDRIVSPAEHLPLYSEGIAQLPHSVFCWASVDEYPLPPPRAANLPIVFGSFNNAMKLSPLTIQLWSNILHAVPHAKLLLKAPSLRDEAVQQRFASLFQAQDIDPSRLIFRGPTGLADMMQEYGDIDIALDPIPYNGGTTTLQALWMGVPVIVLAGNNFVGRMGASFMHTLQKSEWVANSHEEYIAIAQNMARNIIKLRKNRSELRQQMVQSPLCDIQQYTQDFESLLRRMWNVYCEQTDVRVLEADKINQD